MNENLQVSSNSSNECFPATVAVVITFYLGLGNANNNIEYK